MSSLNNFNMFFLLLQEKRWKFSLIFFPFLVNLSSCCRKPQMWTFYDWMEKLLSKLKFPKGYFSRSKLRGKTLHVHTQRSGSRGTGWLAISSHSLQPYQSKWWQSWTLCEHELLQDHMWRCYQRSIKLANIKVNIGTTFLFFCLYHFPPCSFPLAYGLLVYPLIFFFLITLSVSTFEYHLVYAASINSYIKEI